MARLEGQGHAGLHDCPRPRSDARRRARRKTDRPHVTADPVGRGHCDPRSLMNAEQVQPNMPRERPLARFPGLSRNRKTILAICVELNSLDDLELQLQRQTQHARVCNRRRLAADSSWQVGRDPDSERLTFGKDCICIDDIENRALCLKSDVLAGMEDSPQTDVQLIQPRREPATRRHQRDQFRTLS